MVAAPTSVHYYKPGINQELIETVARVEKLVVAHSTEPDHRESSGMAAPTRQFRCTILPNQIPAPFFDRVGVFEKIDMALGSNGTDTSFKSIALFGFGGVGKAPLRQNMPKGRSRGTSTMPCFGSMARRPRLYDRASQI